ncbi:unnamed protein product [Clavelina lepadiformis]|uniref:Thyroglobulin type-1 domain-containing protein n=1 Tax=Clavelina lepadiformis TaxID=159417 RepID=A0ABP0FJ58_CLALP
MTSYLVLSLTLLLANCVIVQCEDSLVARLITSTSSQHGASLCREQFNQLSRFVRRHPGLSRHVELPKCRPDGTFQPLFCFHGPSDSATSGLSICYCVDPHSGLRIEGTMTITENGGQNISCPESSAPESHEHVTQVQ